MRTYEEIHEQIEDLEKELKQKVYIKERVVIKQRINKLEKELYGMKQQEYVGYSLIDEKTYNERMSWLEESKRIMRQGRERNKCQINLKEQ